MYSKYIEISLDRLVSFINLDKNSKSCGSIDRYYWGWKKKDFSDSTLQYAIIPLLKASDSCLDKKSINYLALITFDYLRQIMHNNGSFDQSYPYENHPTTFLDIVDIVVYVLLNQDNEFDDDTVLQAQSLINKGMDFCFNKNETYGVVSNHLAHHVYQYLLVHSVTQENRFYQKAVDILHEIALNTDQEGWHTEYLGGDPGYQTRSLRYLVKCLALLNDNDRDICETLCINSARFLDKCILPDGTIYSMFGSRNTAIIYPSGIEYMAFRYPDMFSNLALRIRNSIKNKVAIVPLQLEFDNFIRLFDDFLDAQIYFLKNKTTLSTESISNTQFDMVNFGLKKLVVNDCAIFVHYKYGGSIVVYKGDKLIYKEAGLLIEGGDGIYYGSKNLQHFSDIMQNNSGVLRIRTVLFKSIHQELTPVKMVVLRLLNLTALRVQWIADLFRKFIVSSIITGNKPDTRNIIIRSISIDSEDSKLVISDELDLNFVAKKLFRSLYLNLFHMASSRYFYPVDRDMSMYHKEKFVKHNDGKYVVTKEVLL